MFVDEEEIAFNLLVERVRELCAADCVGPGLCPFAANLARVHNLGDELEDLVSDPDAFQKARHSAHSGMPPAGM